MLRKAGKAELVPIESRKPLIASYRRRICRPYRDATYRESRCETRDPVYQVPDRVLCQFNYLLPEAPDKTPPQQQRATISLLYALFLDV